MKITDGKVSRTGYLTMRQAALWLGMGSDRAAARRLQRILERLERATGQSLVQRDGGGRGTVKRVTKAILRDYLPEHFSRREKVAGVVREQLNEIRSEVQRLRVENRVTGRVVARILRHLDAQELADDDPRRPNEPTGARRSVRQIGNTHGRYPTGREAPP